MSEKYILLDLEGEKSKHLANVIANDTSRKILDYLADNNANETEISKELKLPASTVHYNVKHLLKSGLIEVKDFFWSDKGNKVSVYKVSNKLVIIAPKKSEFKNRLKDIFVITLIGAAISWGAFTFSRGFSRVGSLSSKQFMVAEMAEADMAAAPMMAGEVAKISEPNLAFWFFIGILTAVIVFILISLIRRKR